MHRPNTIRAAIAALSLACLTAGAWIAASPAHAQAPPVADPGSLAFEEGRWEDVIREYELILEASPEDRLSRLRIAQAQRELGRYDAALETLERARATETPEAMLELERARNLLALGRTDEALAALEAADHVGLRALQPLDEAAEFDAVRGERRFERVYRSVRARVYPCESMPRAADFDFWLGRWEVRGPDGTLLGHSTVSRRDGGCGIYERWQATAGSSGTSMSFYLPSRGLWRQVWVGSGATFFDMTGELVEGEMRMEGTIEYGDLDRVVAFRGSWTRPAEGVVRQRLEEFDIATQSWRLWFDGIYRREEGAEAAGGTP